MFCFGVLFFYLAGVNAELVGKPRKEVRWRQGLINNLVTKTNCLDCFNPQTYWELLKDSK